MGFIFYIYYEIICLIVIYICFLPLYLQGYSSIDQKALLLLFDRCFYVNIRRADEVNERV